MNSRNRVRRCVAHLCTAASLTVSLVGFSAQVHYVDLNSTNATPPFTSWATAATNIQDAVDAAVAGDEIVVTNGIYAIGGRVSADARTNRVTVDKPLSLRSVNGPQFTTIDGDGSVRCVYLTNGASLSGFTLTHGRAPFGGGLRCESVNTVVSNCVVSGNSSIDSTPFGVGSRCCGEYLPVLGGVAVSDHPYAGGVYGGTLYYCTLSDNWAENSGFFSGGGSYCSALSCTLVGSSYGSNESYYRLGAGGGAANATLNNCILTGNRAVYGGGAYGCTLNNCTLTANTAVYIGYGGQAYGIGGGAYHSALNNCISYFNTAADAPNYDSASTLNYSCATPLPTNGVGNTADSPLFVDQASGNLRLQSNSPCINAGDNSYPVGSTDVEGSPRIRGGTVDIGAYEYQSPTSIISYVWLQLYGLPTDGSADFTDPDGDGLNNWQEWRCGTDPTNPLSALRMLGPTNAPNGIAVSWQSMPGISYVLERSTDLGARPAFSLVQSQLVGQPGTTTFIDTNATPAGQFFYRVGVNAP
jgi:hypothetical protein